MVIKYYNKMVKEDQRIIEVLTQQNRQEAQITKKI